MFINSTTKALLISTAFVISSAANAISFNFANIADTAITYNNSISGATTGESGAPQLTFIQGGISVTASGFNADTNAGYNAYLDAGGAGLGVCQTITGGQQCNPSSDDNVTYRESLKLVFDQAVKITTTTFVNGSHNTDFDGNFSLTIDGGATSSYTLVPTFSTILTGTEFVFSNFNGAFDDDGDVKKEFYINAMEVTAVPIPAAAWLFGTGFMGLVGMAKRRKLNS